MQEAVPLKVVERSRPFFFASLPERVRALAGARVQLFLALLTAALLIVSFPEPNWWPLAWVALVPIFVAVAREPRPVRAFFLGWLASTLFFYGSCYWLTYSMIRYGGLPPWIAYPLLAPGAVIVALFPALSLGLLAAVLRRRRRTAWIFLAPLLWTTFEYVRLGVSGQLWNAIGYSQAYMPPLIQTARWGGVYLVGFLIVTVNAALAYLLLERSRRAALISFAVMAGVVAALLGGALTGQQGTREAAPVAVVVGVQANVPMDLVRDPAEMQALLERHLWLSATGLQEAERRGWRELPRVVVWSESPMNFAYTRDAAFREVVADFVRRHHTSLVINSMEPAAGGGPYNSAVMINEEGRLISQYDKIYLLPFGEYVPIPKWLPGAGMISGIVGDFTPGERYPLMPVGPAARAGLFICFESAFPVVARTFSADGADVLLNISNDGYLGPTPVLRQHLANVVLRAVESGRTVLRVTNTGISARITPRGEVFDATGSFAPAVRTWAVSRAEGTTFYAAHGDLFAAACAVSSLILVFLARVVAPPRRRGA